MIKQQQRFLYLTNIWLKLYASFFFFFSFFAKWKTKFSCLCVRQLSEWNVNHHHRWNFDGEPGKQWSALIWRNGRVKDLRLGPTQTIHHPPIEGGGRENRKRINKSVTEIRLNTVWKVIPKKLHKVTSDGGTSCKRGGNEVGRTTLPEKHGKGLALGLTWTLLPSLSLSPPKHHHNSLPFENNFFVYIDWSEHPFFSLGAGDGEPEMANNTEINRLRFDKQSSLLRGKNFRLHWLNTLK